MADGTDNMPVLHVVWSHFDDAAHIVSAQTIAAAEAADAAPMLVDFGDLRSDGGIDELRDRLANLFDVSVEEYVAAIEQSAGRQPVSDDIAGRLAAVADVSFDGRTGDGSDSENGRDLPADDDDFRSDWEIEEAPAEEYRVYQIIAQAMSHDIPSDVFKEFAESHYGNSPAFSGHIDDNVSAADLDALIAALEARGYTVIRD